MEDVRSQPRQSIKQGILKSKQNNEQVLHHIHIMEAISNAWKKRQQELAEEVKVAKQAALKYKTYWEEAKFLYMSSTEECKEVKKNRNCERENSVLLPKGGPVGIERALFPLVSSHKSQAAQRSHMSQVQCAP